MRELSSGVMFRALLSKHPSVDPQMDLGYDPREAAVMECVSPPGILMAKDAPATRKVLQLATGARWRVVSREDNPADPAATTFIIVKIAGIDT